MELVSYRGAYRAAVIGHTGHGNYGHGLDTVFAGLPRVDVVAVADADPAGLVRGQQRSGARRAYADYREMLATEHPDVVSVGPTDMDERQPMVLAAVEAGARAIYCEKPIARSLGEADRMLAACDARGVKVAVAHQNRASPAPAVLHREIAAGSIGRLRMMRGYPKQDSRGGGLELLIHGTHIFDLMRWFAGEARWVHARVTVEGQDAVPRDAYSGAHAAGLMAGDDIVVEVGFDGGVNGIFESMRSDDGGGNDYLRLEVAGTAGILALWSGLHSPVFHTSRPFAVPGAARWRQLEREPVAVAPGFDNQHAGNQVLLTDLLAAVEEQRQPRSSGHDARAALEIILAAYESHAVGERVPLPLAQRSHPLTRWQERAYVTSAS